VSTILYRRQQAAGHILRHHQPASLTLLWCPNHPKLKGQRGNLSADILTRQGVTPAQAEVLAADRKGWRTASRRAAYVAERAAWAERDARRARQAKDLGRAERSITNMLLEELTKVIAPRSTVLEIATPLLYTTVKH